MRKNLEHESIIKAYNNNPLSTGQNSAYSYQTAPDLMSTYCAQVTNPWLAQVPNVRNSRVLDLASGSGGFAHLYHEGYFNLKVTSTDINPIGLGLTDSGSRAQASFSQLPFADHSFQAIHCKDAFAHVEDADQFFSEAGRVLSPFGELLLVTVVYTQSFVVEQKEAQCSLKIPYFAHSIRETYKSAKKAGLSLLSSTSWLKSPDERDWYSEKDVRRQVYRFRKYPTEPKNPAQNKRSLSAWVSSFFR